MSEANMSKKRSKAGHIMGVNAKNGIMDLFIEGRLIVIARRLVTHNGTISTAMDDYMEVFDLENKCVIVRVKEHDDREVCYKYRDDHFEYIPNDEHEKKRGSGNRCKLTPEQIEYIRRNYQYRAPGRNMESFQKMFNTSWETIKKVLTEAA